MGRVKKLERLSGLFFALFFVGGILVFGLFQKQVVEHDRYAEAARAQSTDDSTIPAQRGRIFVKDKNKTLTNLAVSEWRYVLEVSPQLIKNKQKFAEALNQDLPRLGVDTILSVINNDKVYAILDGDLTPTEAETIDKQGYRGVSLRPKIVRSYPEGEAIGAQLLGFVGADGEGKYGTEAIYDDVLKGLAGLQTSQQDSFGHLIDVLGTKNPQPGRDLVLAVDYNLQYVVETKLKEAISKYQAESGMIVVMEPQTGAILALAGQPTYDPNKFSQLRGDEQYRFLAPGASSVYEPGSVMKPITMAMGLDLGLIQPDTTEVFGQSVTVLDKTIMNADEKVFGRENMTQVLENSDNVAMVWLSEKIGAVAERQYLEKFGFGSKSGLDLVGEQSGRLPPEKEWNDLLRSTAAFGQGVSVNLVQLASAYSVIANGGHLVTPHLAEKTLQGDDVQVLDWPSRGQVIKPETAEQVRLMLESVVLNGHGKKAQVSGVRVGGKTGTAQVANPSGGYYDDRTIGTFSGLFPVDNPKFVMAVSLYNPKAVRFAESSAAPTFGEIAEWIANYYQLR